MPTTMPAGSSAPDAPAPHGAHEAASAWVREWAPLIRPGGEVLDVACGAGRHSLWFTERGHHVTAVDRDEAALRSLSERQAGPGTLRTMIADIEHGPWPLPGEAFDAVVVTNYLWRPLWPTLLHSLAEGGVLLAETFALGHERLGRPSNPAFLLRPAELLEVARGLHVVAFEDGLSTNGTGGAACRVQRIAACRSASDATSRGDHALTPGAAVTLAGLHRGPPT